jgi:hypothetical protein
VSAGYIGAVTKTAAVTASDSLAMRAQQDNACDSALVSEPNLLLGKTFWFDPAGDATSNKQLTPDWQKS